MSEANRTEDLGAESIHPRLDKTTFFAATEEGPAKQFHYYSGGFTKREYMAIAAMSGLCANSVPGSHHVPQNLVQEAVEMADLLLKELAK